VQGLRPVWEQPVNPYSRAAERRCRNLSQAFFNLRQTIRDEQAAPPFLDITHGTEHIVALCASVVQPSSLRRSFVR
jgi:hypothetical protein